MNVELKLFLKDLVSGSIRRMEATTRSAFGGIDRSVSGTRSQISGVGQSIDGLTRQLNALRTRRNSLIDLSELSAANREIQQLERNIDRMNRRGTSGGNRAGGGGMLGRYATGAFWGNLGAQGVMMAGRAAVGQIKDVLGGGLEAGAMQEQFKVLAGDNKGTALYGELKKYVADSVFGPELYGNARTMMAFGINPDEVMPDMKMLGDVAMGNKEKMDLLTLAFAQTTSAGKLMGQDLLQYINAGFNPLMVLADKTGKKYDTLKDEMSAGKISADMVKEAFVTATSEGGKFHGMLNKMANTPYGKLQAMQGSLQDAKVGLGVAVAPAVSKLLDGLKPMLDGLPRLFERMAPVMEKAFDRVGELLPDMEALGGAVMDVLKPIGGLLLSEDVGKLGKSVLEMSAVVLNVLTPAVQKTADLLGGLAGVISGVIDYVKGAGDNDVVRTVKSVWDLMNYNTINSRKEREQIERDARWQKDLDKLILEDKTGHTPATVGGALPGVPNSMYGGVPKQMAAVAAPAAMTPVNNSDAITSGGRKVMTINIKSIVENVNIPGTTREEVMSNFETDIKQIMYRVFKGIPA